MSNKSSNNKVMTISDIMLIAEEHYNNAQYNKSINLYDQILTNYPNNYKALFSRAKSLRKINKFQEALVDLNVLLDLPVTKYIVHIHMADNLRSLHLYDEAIDNYRKAIEIKPDHEATYIPAVHLMIMHDRFHEAVDVVDNGIKYLPESSDILSLKGKVHSRLKEFDKAEEAYDKALSTSPREKIKHIITNETAIIKDKLGKYDEAMKLMLISQNEAKMRPEYKQYNTNETDNFISSAQKKVNTSEWNDNIGDNKKDPIFLVGFPRSGTTLMEQILFSHPHLIVTDELGIMPAMNLNIHEVFNKKFIYPNDFNNITEEEISLWRKEYFERMKRNIPNYDSKLRIVDKNPMSFVYLLAVKKFFPQSPILMMIRDPRDVILSCFFQNFVPNSSNAHFFSLEDSAKYYADAMSLYLQFRKNLGLNIMQVKYEDLCDDLEPNLRKIINHIGEDWDDNLLEYYNQEHRYIQTPSFEAVKEPVSKKAIGKWINYEKYFKPILPILEPYLNEFSYC